MEPFPGNAVAVQWEFRCDGKDLPAQPWHWCCRSREGLVVATSKGYFRSLHEAVGDANKNGFRYHAGPEAR